MTIDYDALLENENVISRLPPAEAIVVREFLRRRKLKAMADDFLVFVKHVCPWFVVEEVHVLIAQKFEAMRRGEIDRLMISMPPRTGKLCADSTDVLTTKGWKKHGDLAVGDYVYHPSGKPVRVVAVSEKAEASMLLRVSNGAEIKVHPNHEWTVIDCSTKRAKTLETREFLEPNKRTGKPTPLLTGTVKRRCRFQLPDHGQMQFEEKELLMDPYVLGIWLGDGYASKSAIAMSKEDTDVIVPEFARRGYAIGPQHEHPTTGVITTYITPEGKLGPGKMGRFAREIRELNVYNNKHIPEQYLRGSLQQRLDLAAGLIDSDGHVDETSRVFFSTTNEALRDQVFDLFSTLGFRPYVVAEAAKLSSSGIQGRLTTYKVFCQPTINIPTKLERKKLTRFGVRRLYGITAIEPCEPELGMCIQVDSPDGLYLVTKQLIATHNSLLTSELLPAWWVGHFPNDKILHTSYAANLVEKFGRKIRNMLLDPAYMEMFPGTKLTKDSKAAAQWATTVGGEYNAVGVGGGVAGKGGNLLACDDVISEQQAYSKTAMEDVYEWYGAGFYTRRQPDRNAIVITMTRWNVGDLCGRLLADAVSVPGADQWDNLVIPAVLDEKSAAMLNSVSHPLIEMPHVYKAGDSFSPRRWPYEELMRTKATIGRKAWASLYMQNPVEEDGGVLLRSWWKKWPATKPLPEIEYLLQSYDTAYEDGKQNDFSVRTTWGVFKHPEKGHYCVLLLEAFKDRVQFSALLKNSMDSYNEYKPDRVIVEKAASGIPLVQEMRKRGVPVTPIVPKGNKLSRANAASIPLEQGSVYYIERRWAEEIVDECAAFPNSPHDDVVDSVAHALVYFRRMFLLDTAGDYHDEDDDASDTVPKRSYAVRRTRAHA